MAEQGDATSQCNLGVMYSFGQGVPKDTVEAVKWFRKAAEQGEITAEYNLGASYADGLGVQKDPLEALKWYDKAAKNGHALSQVALGAIYANGKGVPKDYVEAVKWFLKAAEQGNPLGQAALVDIYFNGIGVQKDQIEALAWCNIVVASGKEDFIKMQLGLEKLLGGEKTLVAQERSKQLLKNIHISNLPTKSSYPYGIRSKWPGLIISPYAPDKTMIDCKNLKSGSLAKCPHTGNVFIVP